jgi:hypothetical protein
MFTAKLLMSSHGASPCIFSTPLEEQGKEWEIKSKDKAKDRTGKKDHG